MSREPGDEWELPKEEEPDWAEEIRQRRKARGERYRREMDDDAGERAEPPVGEPPRGGSAP
jgi:hypothetical protein